jgi:hypothetical protein
MRANSTTQGKIFGPDAASFLKERSNALSKYRSELQLRKPESVALRQLALILLDKLFGGLENLL